MYKLHCDLCDRDISKDENITKVTWRDNNGVEFDMGHFFRSKRKFKAHICDECLKLLREANDKKVFAEHYQKKIKF